MPLPTIATPTYELTLPSTGKKIKYRPFLVKEEKILLLAQGSNQTKDLISAVKQIVSEVKRLRSLSPLWEMAQEGVDLSKIKWAAH